MSFVLVMLTTILLLLLSNDRRFPLGVGCATDESAVEFAPEAENPEDDAEDDEPEDENDPDDVDITTREEVDGAGVLLILPFIVVALELVEAIVAHEVVEFRT